MKHIAVIMLLAGSLVGCAGQASSPWLIKRENSKPKSCQPLTSDQELVLSFSQEVASTGRLHAALANLERLPANLPEARLRKAQLLRMLGRSEAEQLYADLVNTCLVADAHHGLGQIEVARKNYSQALEHLRIATSLSPANDAMRNDLGIAYLNLRLLPEAQFELMTAMELNETDTRAAQNMLTLLIYQDKWQNAKDLVASKKLTTAQFRAAEKRARILLAENAEQQAAESQAALLKKKAAPEVVEKSRPVKDKSDTPVSRPSPAPAQPRIAVARPSPVAQPEASAPRPSSVAAQPKATASRPSPVAAQPKAAASRPSPVAAQPKAAASRPSSVAAQPKATASRPSPVAAQPKTTVSRPSPVAAQPQASAPSPRPVAAQPKVSASRPSLIVVQPSTSAASSSQTTVQASQPSTDSAGSEIVIRGVKRASSTAPRPVMPITGY
ncbi:MAG: tetratricopeptide repeat protein [Pseudomonas sp.]|nr:tetratricopeptide repeat protein [Pseudomonas sp.]